MQRAVRFVLTWLLVLTLPLQGVAAATMAACGSRHSNHAAASGHSRISGAVSAVHHAHGLDIAHSHGHHAADPPAHDRAGLVDDDGHKCSACASCCLNAVVPTGGISFGAIELPDLFTALVGSTPAAYMTDGPERPPRRFLA